MTFPSYDEINPFLMPTNNTLPDNIRRGIKNCLASSYEDIEIARGDLENLFRNNGDYLTPLVGINYTLPLIDAYTIDYLPRNFLIPRIAMRALSLNRRTVSFGSEIRVLDCGAGTGAVALGLFDLFSIPLLSNYNLKFYALDVNINKLERQRCILQNAGFLHGENYFQGVQVDISNIDSFRTFLSSQSEWDLIFFANSLSEIGVDSYRNIFGILHHYLAENGSIIIAEPAQDRGKVIIHKIADLIVSQGLTTYYPCNNVTSCAYRTAPYLPHRKCWQWGEYPEIAVHPFNIYGRTVVSSQRPLEISRFILNKCGATIFDDLKVENPELSWGIVRKRGNQHEVCPQIRRVNLQIWYKDGTILGWKAQPPNNVMIEIEI